jgi:hypothetical protein
VKIKQTCIGYIDMSHVLLVTEVRKIPNLHGEGDFFVFDVTVAFQDNPIRYSSEWFNDPLGEALALDDTNKKHKNFISKWKGVS